MRVWTVIMVLLLAGAAYAAEADFDVLDKDKNGTLEQAEIEGGATDVLKKYDKNGDGSLDRKEFQAAGGVPVRFDVIDKDKNGRIGLDEFRNVAVERFKKLDVNRDGRIDRGELRSRQKPIDNPLLQIYF